MMYLMGYGPLLQEQNAGVGAYDGLKRRLICKIKPEWEILFFYEAAVCSGPLADMPITV